MGKKRRSRSKQINRGERDPKLGRETYSALMLLNESCDSLDEALRILQQQKAIELVEVWYYRAFLSAPTSLPQSEASEIALHLSFKEDVLKSRSMVMTLDGAERLEVFLGCPWQDRPGAMAKSSV